MATSPWYREGTAKFTQGSTTVTGTGTRWVDFVRAGDGIQGPDGKLYQVTNVASNTSLSITPAYGSATTYWTIPVQGYVKQLADAAAQLVRDFEGVAVEALDAADRAKQSATEAKASETNAKASETAAKTSEDSAAASAVSANAAKEAAKASETIASEKATIATTKANEASNSASKALASEGKAKTSETNAKSSENAAKASEIAANTSKNQAATSASNATTKATEASNSAAAAKTSETNAKASETAAKTSETNAKGSETIASTKATQATNEATKAKTEADRAESEADRAEQAAEGSLKKSANLSDLANKATARGNLGLGTAATRDVGEESGNVMEVGAFGLGGTSEEARSYPVATTPTGFSRFIDTGDPVLPQCGMSVVFGSRATPATAAHNNWLGQLFSNTTSPLALKFRRSINGEEWEQPVTLHHTGNIRQSTGTSTEYPMSQKAVTDEFGKLKEGARRDVVSSPTDTSGGNKLVTQGWMGLGDPLGVHLFDGDDLNNITGANRFFSWIGANILNNPTGYTYGAGFTFGWRNGEGLTQIVWGSGKERWYVRQRDNGYSAWTPWREILHTGKVLQSTGSSTQFLMSQKAVTDAINGVSDRRDKAEIEDLEVGLSLIKNLKPKLYKLNLRSWYRDQEATIEEVTTDPETGEEITSVSADPDVLAKPLSEYDDNDGSLAKDKPYTGFIAQELDHTLKELGLDDLGLVKNYQDEYGGDDRYYIEHEGLLAFIVRAIQEQQEQIEKLQLKVEQLEARVIKQAS